jgi:hypothetical protein
VPSPLPCRWQREGEGGVVMVKPKDNESKRKPIPPYEVVHVDQFDCESWGTVGHYNNLEDAIKIARVISEAAIQHCGSVENWLGMGDAGLVYDAKNQLVWSFIDEYRNQEEPPKESPAVNIPLLERAIEIATKAHSGKKDKGGSPFILHPLRLMMQMDSEEEMITAVLHDLIESTEEWTLDDLRKVGFDEKILDGIDHITQRESEENNYEIFIRRVAENEIARKIKLVDLADNMDMRRLNTLTENDLKRLDKYHKAWLVLKEKGTLAGVL